MLGHRRRLHLGEQDEKDSVDTIRAAVDSVNPGDEIGPIAIDQQSWGQIKGAHR